VFFGGYGGGYRRGEGGEAGGARDGECPKRYNHLKRVIARFLQGVKRRSLKRMW